MVEPEEYSYEEFPESSTVTRGMNVIEFEDDIASVVCLSLIHIYINPYKHCYYAEE